MRVEISAFPIRRVGICDPRRAERFACDLPLIESLFKIPVLDRERVGRIVLERRRGVFRKQSATFVCVFFNFRLVFQQSEIVEIRIRIRVLVFTRIVIGNADNDRLAHMRRKVRRVTDHLRGNECSVEIGIRRLNRRLSVIEKGERRVADMIQKLDIDLIGILCRSQLKRDLPRSRNLKGQRGQRSLVGNDRFFSVEIAVSHRFEFGRLILRDSERLKRHIFAYPSRNAVAVLIVLKRTVYDVVRNILLLSASGENARSEGRQRQNR